MARGSCTWNVDACSPRIHKNGFSLFTEEQQALVAHLNRLTTHLLRSNHNANRLWFQQIQEGSRRSGDKGSKNRGIQTGEKNILNKWIKQKVFSCFRSKRLPRTHLWLWCLLILFSGCLIHPKLQKKKITFNHFQCERLVHKAFVDSICAANLKLNIQHNTISFNALERNRCWLRNRSVHSHLAQTEPLCSLTTSPSL